MIKIMNVWSDSSLDYLVLPVQISSWTGPEKKDFAIYDVSWKNETIFQFNAG
jgi:hypothetical protein